VFLGKFSSNIFIFKFFRFEKKKNVFFFFWFYLFITLFYKKTLKNLGYDFLFLKCVSYIFVFLSCLHSFLFSINLFLM
jgi:hypothetical protein